MQMFKAIYAMYAAAVFLAAMAMIWPSAGQATSPPVPQMAVFAGGCFWCMEAEFADEKGVLNVTSGYMGGDAATATYDQVSSGDTGHIEVVQVVFDPSVVTYDRLLKIFWSNVDPTDAAGQFCDKGSQYAAGIFYIDDAQKVAAEASVKSVAEKLGTKVASFLRPAMVFYAAEAYHQDYYKKNALSYKMYKTGCGRDRRLQDIWKDK